MEGLPSAARQLIFEGIFTARCRAARYLAYNFNDLPNNIAAVAAGGAGAFRRGGFVRGY